MTTFTLATEQNPTGSRDAIQKETWGDLLPSSAAAEGEYFPERGNPPQLNERKCNEGELANYPQYTGLLNEPRPAVNPANDSLSPFGIRTELSSIGGLLPRGRREFRPTLFHIGTGVENGKPAQDPSASELLHPDVDLMPRMKHREQISGLITAPGAIPGVFLWSCNRLPEAQLRAPGRSAASGVHKSRNTAAASVPGGANPPSPDNLSAWRNKTRGCGNVSEARRIISQRTQLQTGTECRVQFSAALNTFNHLTNE